MTQAQDAFVRLASYSLRLFKCDMGLHGQRKQRSGTGRKQKTRHERHPNMSDLLVRGSQNQIIGGARAPGPRSRG